MNRQSARAHLLRDPFAANFRREFKIHCKGHFVMTRPLPPPVCFGRMQLDSFGAR